MTENTPYQQLTRTFQRLSRFSHLAAIAGWDMFAMMPPGGSVARGEALAELGVLAINQAPVKLMRIEDI